jgi:uncharacterized protein YecE (DUF72 family)
VGRARIGCSGWNYRDWRGSFYPTRLPARRWLEYYARQFDTVEVNATFYRLPSREAVARWAAQTPDDFEFAVKASRYVTHVRRLREMDEGVERFYDRIEPLQAASRLGPVLWQLPPTFKRDDERLEQALRRLPPGRHAFEFRHQSWFTAEVVELLHAYGAELVLADDGRRPPEDPFPTAAWRYVRLHYGRRGRGGNYSARELDEWAERVAEWRREGDVYVYFNNDWRAFAPRNAAELAKRLDIIWRPEAARGVAAPLGG